MKSAKKFLHWLVSPFVIGCLVTFTIVYGAFQYYDRYQDSAYNGESRFFDVVRQLHQKSIDWRLIQRGPQLGDPNVAILTVDEASLEQEGRWPWPREKIAKVVEHAMNLGAKTIAFDMIFAEEDSNSSKPTLARLQRVLASQQPLTEQTEGLFSKEIQDADSDQKFSETIAKYADHLVMGGYYEEFDRAGLEKESPFIDSCIDVLHERSTSGTYWANDQRVPVVTDQLSQKAELPKPLKEHLSQYFLLLEATQIDSYLKSNPSSTFILTSAIERSGLSKDFPIPPLLSSYLKNDRDSMSANIEAVTGQAADPKVLDAVFQNFREVVSKKESAIIQAQIRGNNIQYCARFLIDDEKNPKANDELLSESAFKDRYAGNEFADQFDALSWESVWSEANKNGVELPTGNFNDYLTGVRVEPKHNMITSIDRWWLNIPVLSKPTKFTGYFNAYLDSDGTVRRSMLISRRGNHYFNSLALDAFLVSQGLSASAVILPTSDPRFKGIPLQYASASTESTSANPREPASEKTASGFEIINAEGEKVLSVPVDPSGRMAINYSGPKYSFAHISAADLLSDKETMEIRYRAPAGSDERQTVKKADFLKDKILFFGATATGIFDLRVTPFEENFPGVETHANMLSNLLVEYARATGKGDSVKGMPGFLRTYPEREAQYMLPAMLVLGVLLSALLSYFGSIVGLGLASSAIGSVYAIDRFVLFDQGIVITVLFPLTLISSIFVVLTFYKYFTEERKKRELKGTFEKYVSPAIVAEVLAHPENIELGGKKMELTVMFSDVRGFTTISEKLDPRALSDLLNSYLTPMTNLVFKNKGTLDKYMGDAIMAFWGAPVHFKDHAAHACRCALQMIEELKEMQLRLRAQNLPAIDIGIGLNTGEMSVGNMGSDTVRSYTVMGDAVNLGSRLEGINKQYGTRIIISEFTHKEVSHAFVCREVDWVRVKGKLQPVRIFELVGENGKVDGKTLELIKKFNEGFATYHERAWEKAEALFTECLHLVPDDEPSQLYLERCAEYKQEAPPADWDGVYNLKEK